MFLNNKLLLLLQLLWLFISNLHFCGT